MAQVFAYSMATSVLAAYLQADDGGGIPWWVWVILIIVLLLLLLIGFARQPEPGEPLPKLEERVVPPAVAPEPESVEETEEAPPTPDDLRRIEGIGPKIASILNEDGITTFAGLAAADVGHLRRLLDDAGIRLADPATWPQQAELAAAEKWEELGALQDNLKGGRQD